MLRLLERLAHRLRFMNPEAWDLTDDPVLAARKVQRHAVMEVESELERCKEEAREHPPIQLRDYSSSLTCTRAELEAAERECAGMAELAYVQALDVEHRAIMAQGVGWVRWSMPADEIAITHFSAPRRGR